MFSFDDTKRLFRVGGNLTSVAEKSYWIVEKKLPKDNQRPVGEKELPRGVLYYI